MVQWRRYYDTTTHGFDKITAMAVSPDGTKLAVHGSLIGGERDSFIFVIRPSDGGHETEIARVRHGQVDLSEHIVSDPGIVFGASGMVFLAFKQISRTLRTKGSQNNYAGRMMVGAFNPATSQMDWVKEHSLWGYSASIVYKNYGAGQPNLFVGGSIDENPENNNNKSWRPAIMRLKEDGTSGLNADFLIQSELYTDESKSPYIDNMHLDDTVSGEEWLFGTTRNLDIGNTAKEILFWKCDLDPITHNPRDDNMVVTHLRDGQIENHGWIIGVKPTLVNGDMHLLYNSN